MSFKTITDPDFARDQQTNLQNKSYLYSKDVYNEIEMTSWAYLTYHNLKKALSTTVVKALGLCFGLYVLAVAVGLEPVNLEGGTVWRFFGDEIPTIEVLYESFFATPLVVLISIILPVGVSHRVQQLVAPSTTQYLLPRPISRAQGVLSHIGGVALAYTLLMGTFSLLLCLVILTKGNFVSLILWPGFLFVPVSISIHVLLIFIFLSTRSLGISLTAVILYNSFVSKYFFNGLSGDVWYTYILDRLFELMYFLLPPTFELMELSAVYTQGSISSGPIPSGGQVLLASALSIGVCSCASVLIYRRLDF